MGFVKTISIVLHPALTCLPGLYDYTVYKLENVILQFLIDVAYRDRNCYARLDQA